LGTTASIYGLSISTTYASVDSIFCFGIATNKADYLMIDKILLPWLLTLPIAAIVSALLFKISETIV